MGMFDRYDKLNSSYIPNNSTEINTEYVTVDTSLPRCVYDIHKKQLGYSWNFGEHFKFNLSISCNIKVSEDSIVYEISGETPTENTQAQRIGQQCYNIKDAKSWTFVGVSSERYIWIEDKQFIYNKGEDKEIDVSIDMTDKIAELSIYDFRWNKIHSVCSDTNSSEISLNVDSELDKIVKPGIYYCTLKIIGEQQSQIKDKFIIIVN